jgi:alpha-mannosidase
VSNEVDFFQDFLASYGSQIPTFSGAFGNEWDLYTASMGEVTADFRRHIEKLRTGEAMASVVSLFDPTFMSSRTAARDLAFMAAGLYYEHDWTADGPVSRATRAQFQRNQLANLTGFVDPLVTDATGAIGARIAQPGSSERWFVFNPLSWPRNEAADLPSTTAAPLHVIDVATNAEVPSQVVGSGATRRVRILASSVPAVGYRVYEVRPGAGLTFPAAASVNGATADNGLYAVTLGPSGAITSVLDRKDGNRQLVEAGGSLNALGSGAGTVVVEDAGPVSVTLRVVAGGTPSHETRVTLYAGLDRIDVEGTITSNFSNNVSYDYRFDLAGATLRHEEVGMIAKVARAAQGGDYADQNTRTDWLTFGHFADFSTGTRGVTLSNWDSPFFQAGNSTVSTLDGATPRLKACVGMQVDGTTYGIASQGGDSRFTNRFALRTHGAYDAAGAMRFALEHQNPLVAGRVTGNASSALPGNFWQLLELPGTDVVLWALKPAEEGISQGLIARVWNVSEQSRSFSLGLPGSPISSARRVTHLETDLGPAALAGSTLTGSLARQQMATYRLFPGSTAADVTPPARVIDLNSQ